jgi:hypothetical protein
MYNKTITTVAALMIISAPARHARLCRAAEGDGQLIEMAGAVIASPENLAAAEVLADELGRRTGNRPRIVPAVPENNSAVILATSEGLDRCPPPPASLAVPEHPEGFAIDVEKNGSSTRVWLAGRTKRAVLFAAGKLLRILNTTPGSARLEPDIHITTEPAKAVRGHMLIPKKDDFAKWDEKGLERLVRELALFGTNTFEFIRLKELRKAVTILARYDLDASLYLGAGKVCNYTGEEQFEKTFAPLDKLDAVFVPGGDSGKTAGPRTILPCMEKFASLCKKAFPDARLWYSIQAQQNHAVHENDFVFDWLERKKPPWLEGLVFGPWTDATLPEMRRSMPAEYAIRFYPDICHNNRCQYQLPAWDRALARVWGRDGISVRPLQMAMIFKHAEPYTRGFVAYNHTGCNNDLNKFIFSALAWDPKAKIKEVLTEYARAVMQNPEPEETAEGLLMLEGNWTGPIEANENVEKTLRHWQKIAEKTTRPASWRTRMYLFRATADAWVRRKTLIETECQSRALEALGQARHKGPGAAVAKAKAELARADTLFPPKEDLLRELQKRGLDDGTLEVRTVLKNLYFPLNDRYWLEDELKKILAMDDMPSALAAINAILKWEDPGAGGFYDNLGVVGSQPHLVKARPYHLDPGYRDSVIEFNHHDPDSRYRQSWLSCAFAIYDNPLLMRYEGLDPDASYRVKATYSGPFRPVMTLTADGKYPVHGPVRPPRPMRPLEFEIPREATGDGKLELAWQRAEPVRGAQVAEVWLIRRPGPEKKLNSHLKTREGCFILSTHTGGSRGEMTPNDS